MRAQAAADAVTKQKDAVEKSREYELSRVKTQGGKTRLELEKEIKDLQDKIFKIEEEKLEPAQEFIRLRQIILDKDIEGLTVLGLTKDAWEAIKNQVDLALIKSAAFVDSMKLALDIQQRLIDAYKAQTSAQPVAQGQVSGAKENLESYVKPQDTPEDVEALKKFIATVEEIDAAQAAADKAAQDSAQNTGNGADAAYDRKVAAQAAARLAALQAAYDATLPKYDPNNSGGGAGGFFAMSSGGMVPKMFAAGGFAKGTDTVPAMLTPGEFIMSKYAVDTYGVDTMRKINNGESVGGAVYNNTYTLTVNAKTNANPNEIAQAVMSTIKQVDDRRIRGVSLNARN
jgi:hypothetical protein